MAKKNLMVPLTGVRVVRDGVRVKPVIGSPFQFEDDEIEQLTGMGAKFRAPSNEADASEGEVAASSTSAAEKAQAAAKGGTKEATAAKSDGEAAAAKGDDDL